MVEQTLFTFGVNIQIKLNKCELTSVIAARCGLNFPGLTALTVAVAAALVAIIL